MLLLWMSITGSVPLIIFLVLWLIQRNSFNYLLGKILLCLSMIFYLIPFQLLTGILPENVYDVTPIKKIRTLRTSQFHFEYGNSTYISIKDGIMWLPIWLIFILCIWFIIMLIFAIYQVTKYIKSMKYLIKNSEEKICDITDIGTVPILVNNNIHTPYTVGFIHSRIIFPEDLIESKHSTIIYKHEYCHMKNHDALMKLICLIIVCLHWFNPIAILLLFAYDNMCEYVSDDYVSKSLNHTERKQYANLLLDIPATREMPVVWKNNFSATRFLFQRRLKYIMMKKFGRMQKLITVVVSVVTVLTSSMTVFAYEPMQSSSEIAVSDLMDGDFMEFIPEDEYNNELSVMRDYFSCGDNIFISETGEIFNISDNDISPHAICNHVFINGTYNKHASDGKGGCTVYVYNAQICKKCNYLKVGSLIQTNIYVTCPHNN